MAPYGAENITNTGMTVGKTFSSYTAFETDFKDNCKAHGHVMRKENSRKNTIPDSYEFPYKYLTFICVHGAARRQRGKGIRPNQHYNAKGCPVFLKLILLTGKNIYLIKECNWNHNHVVNPLIAKHYPSNRTLTDQEKNEAAKPVDSAVLVADLKNLKVKVTGKSVIVQDIHNVNYSTNSTQQNGCNELESLHDCLRKYQSADPGATFHMRTDSSGSLTQLFMQTSEMLSIFNAFPSPLFIDGTYKLKIEDYPLYPIMVIDGEGHGRPVAYSFVRNDTQEELMQVFQDFSEAVQDTSKVEVFIVNNDNAEINACKEVFPNATILLCIFHVMTAMERKIASSVGKAEKERVLSICKSMMYSNTEEEYDVAYKSLLKEAPPCFVEYFTTNWMNSTEMWVRCHRLHVPTFGSNTTNIMASHHRKLKDFIKKDFHINEAIEKMFLFLQRYTESLSYQNYVHIKSIADTRHNDVFHSLAASMCTDRAFKIVSKEYAEVKAGGIFCCHTGDSVIVVEDGTEYMVSKHSPTVCVCSFYHTMRLPCRHIFAAREYLQVQPIAPDMIITRWKRGHVVAPVTCLREKKTENLCPTDKISKIQHMESTLKKIGELLPQCGEKQVENYYNALNVLYEAMASNAFVIISQSNEGKTSEDASHMNDQGLLTTRINGDITSMHIGLHSETIGTGTVGLQKSNFNPEIESEEVVIEVEPPNFSSFTSAPVILPSLYFD